MKSAKGTLGKASKGVAKDTAPQAQGQRGTSHIAWRLKDQRRMQQFAGSRAKRNRNAD